MAGGSGDLLQSVGVWSLGFKVSGLGFRVWGCLGFRMVGFRVWGLEFWV